MGVSQERLKVQPLVGITLFANNPGEKNVIISFPHCVPCSLPLGGQPQGLCHFNCSPVRGINLAYRKRYRKLNYRRSRKNEVKLPELTDGDGK
ncbi:hypothetical protein AVEN_262163-1 [Araneus ventricosus]|uniref:Uncharacterized protein n=1 Tax=Araneus ventricosus TaxID=182803 RepID=A0A4Y2EKD3_ARAVE|nr:hypothetical protein AVEN_262163-1 [Araneus ventricosus]